MGINEGRPGPPGHPFAAQCAPGWKRIKDRVSIHTSMGEVREGSGQAAQAASREQIKPLGERSPTTVVISGKAEWLSRGFWSGDRRRHLRNLPEYPSQPALCWGGVGGVPPQKHTMGGGNKSGRQFARHLASWPVVLRGNIAPDAGWLGGSGRREFGEVGCLKQGARLDSWIDQVDSRKGWSGATGP